MVVYSHNFKDLDTGLQDTKRRLDEQQAEINRRFSEYGKTFGQSEAQLSLVKLMAQQITDITTYQRVRLAAMWHR